MRLAALLRHHPLTARLLLLVALPILIGGSWFWNELRHSLPRDGATHLTQGVSAPATIWRDERGAVHVKAANGKDAYYAIGYAQAQDRLWQLELQRRMARGRLSELFGKSSIDADVWFRTLGLHDSARSAWPALSEPARESLTAYTAGLNAAVAEMSTLPLEFRIFGIKPEPWTEIDSLAWVKVFALNLGGNFRSEIDRHLVDRILAPHQSAVFFPEYSIDALTTLPSGTRQTFFALADWHDRLQRDQNIAHIGTGSNAWAVAGRLTSSGGALLANDPHLGLQMPSPWYVISVDAPDLKISGMSLVGLPVVVFGRNDRIAWAGTSMMADTQDLFIERADAEGRNYEFDGTWHPFEVRSELIHVRADFPQRLRRPNAPVKLNIRRSHNGPVISDYFRFFDAPVTLRWNGLDANDTSYEALFRLGYAQDWSQFTQALDHHVAPAMNMFYADRTGNIGYLAAGHIPIRKKGRGTAPVPGWNAAYGWSGSIPSAHWPRAYNPPSGYLVNANNRIVGEDYPYFISNNWASPARARRIEQLLRDRIDSPGKLTADDMMKFQADTLDLEASTLLEVLRRHLPQDDPASQPAGYLNSWNGDMRSDSQAAAILHAWMRHFRNQLFADRLKGTWGDPQSAQLLRKLGGTTSLAQLAHLLDDDDNGWCTPGDGSAPDSCSRLLVASLADALSELHKLQGDWSMESWRWGEFQQTRYPHAPMSGIKPLNKFFERRISNGGSSNSINVASSRFIEGEGYVQEFGASFRQVIELSPTRITHDYMNSTGQSGNVLSRHYDDMVEPFQAVRYFRLNDGGVEPSPQASSRGAVP